MRTVTPPIRARRALAPLRASDWWEHKLAPMLGTGYLTALHMRVSLLGAWPAFAAALVGVAATASYVSLINDLTDRVDDADAGKPNRLAACSGRYVRIAFTIVLAVGVTVGAIAWRHDALALALYAGPWLAFSAYSLPPVRFKARGAFGLLCDASGAHLFPALLVTVAVAHSVGRPLDAVWLTLVGVWALATGIRGALWHQLGDVHVDRRAGVPTFASRHAAGAGLIGRCAFLVEVIALGSLLWQAGSVVAVVLLTGYLVLELGRVRLLHLRLIVVNQAAGSRIALHEYYLLLYPLGGLIAASLRHPEDLLVLAVHGALLFGAATRSTTREARTVLKLAGSRRRRGSALAGRSPS